MSLRKLSLVRTYVLEDIRELLHKYSKHLIRIATMNAFDLSHTCCKIACWKTTTGSGSPEWATSLEPRFGRIETNEIQVEERLLISEFTSVVNELESLYQQQDIPLSTFIHTVWKDKMLELMEGDVEPSETDMQQLAAVGVKLSDPQSVDIDEEYDDEYDGEYDDECNIKGSYWYYPTPYRYINFWLALFDTSQLTTEVVGSSQE